ncbi:glycoside hydrolase family 5 protein [Solirubrobacter phytolaccae]|uniref:Glycoside hydrolase family 5 protein n=1 Tax=Solirubrobacter phytolaccae TaxID=1404360 RepID=A0A9X3NAG4_9ACTN|nr:cellulase family glycosylhydrolase [Solirubrobacter phytolaccae]MDA0182995.1 glycoside hydrolase family 5 protein [Solirubrobacter phytolaccae]
MLGAWSMIPSSAAAATKLAGVQAHLLWANVDTAEMKRQLDLVKSSGSTITRVDVGWSSLQETGPDSFSSYHLGRLDALVNAAEARGIKLLLTFTWTPCWASSAPESLKQGCAGEWWSRGVDRYVPKDPAAYASALGKVAARYKGRVKAWEIWNEPNHEAYFKAPDQAAAYAALVKAAYPAVKAADPNATVVAGSLSASDHAFTTRLYQLGIKGSFDAFSIHPYSDDVSPLDPRIDQDPKYSFIRGVPAVRDVMVANGDGAKPMWLTEAGYSTSPTRSTHRYLNGVSEATQAEFVKLQVQQVAKWSYVDATIWFNLKDTSNDVNDLYANCGLRRWDGSAKPAWAAFQDSIAILTHGEEQPGPGPQLPEGPREPLTPAPPAPQTPAPVDTAPVVPVTPVTPVSPVAPITPVTPAPPATPTKPSITKRPPAKTTKRPTKKKTVSAKTSRATKKAKARAKARVAAKRKAVARRAR